MTQTTVLNIVCTAPTKGEVEAAGALATIGFALALDAYNNLIEANECLEDLQKRRLEMACTMHDHVLGVTHPFLQCAMEEACNYPVDEPDYGGICSQIGSEIHESFEKAQAAYSHYAKLFCIEEECTGQLGAYAGMASVDATMARIQAQRRRKERQREARTQVIHRAHAGTMRRPDAIFGFLDTAAEIYGNIQAQFSRQLSGGLATFGYFSNQFFSGLGSL